MSEEHILYQLEVEADEGFLVIPLTEDDIDKISNDMELLKDNDLTHVLESYIFPLTKFKWLAIYSNNRDTPLLHLVSKKYQDELKYKEISESKDTLDSDEMSQ